MVFVHVEYRHFKKWLYFETGLNKYEPVPEITLWMEERGYRYRKDWFCEVFPPSKYEFQTYAFSFATEEMANMFLLRWA